MNALALSRAGAAAQPQCSQSVGVVVSVTGRTCQVRCDDHLVDAIISTHIALIRPSQQVCLLHAPGCPPLVTAAWPTDAQDAGPMLELDEASGTLSISASRLKLAGVASVELACGDASVRVTVDGRVEILGNEILSAAYGSHRIEGGSIDLN